MQGEGLRCRPCQSFGLVARCRRATPAEPIVYAELGGMFVISKPGANHRGGSASDGGAAEVVILVLGFRRPVRREHVFQTGTDGVAVLVGRIGAECYRCASDANPDVGIIAPRIAALAINQRGTPSVAKPARDRAELVVVRGHQSAAGEKHTVVVV